MKLHTVAMLLLACATPLMTGTANRASGDASLQPLAAICERTREIWGYSPETSFAHLKTMPSVSERDAFAKKLSDAISQAQVDVHCLLLEDAFITDRPGSKPTPLHRAILYVAPRRLEAIELLGGIRVVENQWLAVEPLVTALIEKGDQRPSIGPPSHGLDLILISVYDGRAWNTSAFLYRNLLRVGREGITPSTTQAMRFNLILSFVQLAKGVPDVPTWESFRELLRPSESERPQD